MMQELDYQTQTPPRKERVDPPHRKITKMDILKIDLTGRAYLGEYREEGWAGTLPLYAFRCARHGIVANYPMGFEKRLECPRCLAERLARLDDVAAVRPLEVPDQL